MSTNNNIEIVRADESDEGFSLELQDRISRQLGTFGFEAVGKLMKMRVFISGMNAVGVETAKNLILAGPHTVTLHDDNPVQITDCGANFFIREQDVGKSRADTVTERLAELNDFVKVNQFSGSLADLDVTQYEVVVLANPTQPELLNELNQKCRENGVGFILVGCHGLSGYTFVDFGDNHATFDKNGVPPTTFIVTDITHEEEAIVSGLPGEQHGLDDGDWVEFTEVEGMTELNDLGPIQIKRKNAYQFTIGDTTKFGEYTRQGMVTEVKVRTHIDFKPLAESRLRPKPESAASYESGFILTDYGKFGRAQCLHIAYQALWAFQSKNGALPKINDDTDAQQIVQLALGINASNKELDATTCENEDELKMVAEYVAKQAGTELSPMASFFGGVCAQEIVKFTGKYTPLHQWLYMDAFELVPETQPTDTAPIGSRYDHQISIWGKALQDKLADLKVFMVGSGALGCEYFKGFAMMGVACGENGQLVVTDNDTIEISNLNRQFLFRMHNVGKGKSESAAEAAVEMNPAIRVDPRTTLVCPDTEDVFDDAFWESLDVVQNALDNVKAREYVDGRCVLFGLPLIESGTLGTKGNAQPCVPKKAASYTDSGKDPEEKSIPMCTLRNFPSKIEHCCEWARAQFEDRFAVAFQETQKFCEDPQDWVNKVLALANPNTARSKLEMINEVLSRANSIDLQECVAMAVESYLSNFRDRVAQLVHLYPEDFTDDDGNLFWSGDKRFPTVLNVDVQDERCMDYIMAAANLYAASFGLQVSEDIKRNTEEFTAMIGKVDIPDFVPKSNVRIKVNPDDDVNDGADDDENERDRLAKVVLSYKIDGDRLEPADFEKDDDSNFHIDFISACANLRARNYRLKEVTRHRTKMIAGKIIPAVATTTTMISGLALLEFLKLWVFEDAPIESFRSSYVDLATSIYTFFEPMPPSKQQDVEYDPIVMGPIIASPPGWTNWDFVELHGKDGTMQECLDLFTKETGGLTATEMLKNNAGPNEGFMYEEGMTDTSAKVQDLWEAHYGPIPADKKFVILDSSSCNADDEDTKTPLIKYYLPVE